MITRFKRDTSIHANFFAFLFFAKNRKKFRILWEEGEEIVKQLLLAFGLYCVNGTNIANPFLYDFGIFRVYFKEKQAMIYSFVSLHSLQRISLLEMRRISPFAKVESKSRPF